MRYTLAAPDLIIFCAAVAVALLLLRVPAAKDEYTLCVKWGL